MSNAVQQTLEDLQLPTMSLVEKFCATPEEVKIFFAGMLSVYENNPTKDNIQRIAEQIKSGASRQEKQAWLAQELEQIDTDTKYRAMEKYIKQKNAVPAGLPTSGQLLSFLDYIPRAVKDELMNAQAAARILSHLEKATSDLKTTIISYDEEGKPKENKEFLDKSFVTGIQRTEQIADFFSAYKKQETAMDICKRHDEALMANAGADIDPLPETRTDQALEECKKYALQTLYKTAEKIASYYPEAAERIASLAQSYGPEPEAPAKLALISSEAIKAADICTAYYGTELRFADMPPQKTDKSFNEQEALLFKQTIKKRAMQIQNENLRNLSKEDRSL